MKTKKQYFKESEREMKRSRMEYNKKIAKEIDEMSTTELKWTLFDKWHHILIYSRHDEMIWDMAHEECRFCGVEYIRGRHEDCCDDCFEKNKGKSLEELERM